MLTLVTAAPVTIDGTAIITGIVGVLTAIGAFLGAVKLVKDSGNAQSNSVITSYKDLAEELRAQRTQDREDHARDMTDVRGRLDTAEAEIAHLRAQAERDKNVIRRLLARITYLTTLLSLHAPDVTVDPMQEDLTAL